MDITGADLHAGSFAVASGFDVVFEDVIPNCVGKLPSPHVTSVPPIRAQRSGAVNHAKSKAVTIFAMKTRFTERQGQYLAFIHYYTKVNGKPPAEADMQRYFRVTPPSVHQMVVTLAANGFIERVPGQGRSIRLLIPREELPELE
jgi:repressor LexA